MAGLYRSFAVVSIALAMLIPFRVAFAVTVEDQGQIYGTGGTANIGAQISSQSITAGITGQLMGIQIMIEGFPTATPQLVLGLRSGGTPLAGTILASQTFPIEAADEILFDWDVSGWNLFFNSGDEFTFELSSPSPGGYVISGNDPPGYDGGELFLNGGPGAISDIAFITSVDPDAMPAVPLPAAFWLLGSGLAGLLELGRGRKKWL